MNTGQITEAGLREMVAKIFAPSRDPGQLLIRAENEEAAIKRSDELIAYVKRCRGEELAAKMNRQFGLPRIVNFRAE
ncbi:MAG: hypothetical protein WC205_04185 [Opitutaceae bacterium]|jgi:hypothetical protein